MGNFLTKPAKWRLLNKKEIDEDWATNSNWICNDQLCPNPYTHARGDPCKLTMEDLFPSRPKPPTSEDTKKPEDESEDWLKEWDRENRDKKKLDLKNKAKHSLQTFCVYARNSRL
jgi:hypothetical protein